MSSRTKVVKSSKAQTPVTPEAALLQEILTSHAPAEDLQGYEPASIGLAANLALAAVKKYRQGSCVIEVEGVSEIERHGRAVSTITIVNDNMPFLFDSVMGEITERGLEPLLVVHPILLIRSDADTTHILGNGTSKQAEDADRVSLIHIHLPPATPKECEELRERLIYILSQVRAAVGDWKRMLSRLDLEIAQLRRAPVPLEKDAVAEAAAFLEWLRDDNFVFLGMREMRYLADRDGGALERCDEKGLGILASPDVRVLRRGDETIAATPEIQAFLHGPEPIIVTKANAKSLVHRRAYLDYIGVKSFNDEGALTGELRIVGLFASTAYTRSVLRIPYLRAKAQKVIADSGFATTDHLGKALITVLESYPRDELFQISLPRLREHAAAILALNDRPRVRVLYRIDQFDRFVSAIVFLPRERYDSRVCARIGDYLKNVFEGRLSAYYPAFPEGALARVHFIIGRSGGATPRIGTEELEEAIREIVRTWDDALRETASEEGVADPVRAIAARFDEGYRNAFDPHTALIDASRIAALSAEDPLAIDFHRRADQSDTQAALKIYHFGTPVALSRRVPLLENMGFRVISERTFEMIEPGGSPVFLHDMELESAFDSAIDLSDGGTLFDDVFLSVWRRERDNDGLNALAHRAGLGASQIAVLRAYSRFLHQAGIPQSQGFIAETLNRYPHITAKLLELFMVRFGLLQDPASTGEGADRVEREIEEALESVPNLEDDTIVRRFLNLIKSTLRTNYFTDMSQCGHAMALKFDSEAIDGLPQPRPWREIFVYGPDVEGVHLRYGPIARGGLRWSDRAQDYRTEVLSLVKAQQVKNSVIVPVGAKGGFHPRRLPKSGDRQEIFEAGKRSYINFISALLSITDNLEADKVVPPENVVRHDENDPYLVVAADKGTATFSDTANEISQRHGFWLDDAFASGGSAGYDHKAMAITARGAWEAVKRHFREMNRDIQKEPFTAIGVGDMSGDVFGNGMLRSPCTKLIAAFDHRDIFIDPDPDPAISFEERKRLFEIGRSSWQDYDLSKLSKGGIILSRSMKQATLPREAADAIGLADTTATPAEIVRAILKSPVDLLWFGGIGTFVRGSDESNQEVGDRVNDPVRITASEIGAKVVGEGANLGMTQQARIEFNLKGGRCNSDAIDNSAGVNSSDLEVNIKIALAAAMRSGKLTRPARNELLAQMTDEVAALVLRNNYLQTLAISLVQDRGLSELPHQARMMTLFENQGLLDRAVEFLPGPEALAERQARGVGLTRAEIGVLLAYSKLALFDQLVESQLPDDPYFEADLFAYFPKRMQHEYETEIQSHRLRREIIATELANDIINLGGPTFITRLQDETGRPAPDIAEAFVVARDGFALKSLISAIDALDNKIDGEVQLSLYQRVYQAIAEATARQLKRKKGRGTTGERVRNLNAGREALQPVFHSVVPGFLTQRIEEEAARLRNASVPPELAEKLAWLHVQLLVPDILYTAEMANVDLADAAKTFFAITEMFRLNRIESAASDLAPTDYFDALALSQAMNRIDAARRAMAVAALANWSESDEPALSWADAGGERVVRVRERLQALVEGGEITVSRLSVAAGLMADLAV